MQWLLLATTRMRQCYRAGGGAIYTWRFSLQFTVRLFEGPFEGLIIYFLCSETLKALFFARVV